MPSKHDGDFSYYQGLRLHDVEVSRLRNIDMKNLLCRKKLYLVLDLDHTLLNSTRLNRLSQEEMPIITQESYLEGIHAPFLLVIGILIFY